MQLFSNSQCAWIYQWSSPTFAFKFFFEYLHWSFKLSNSPCAWIYQRSSRISGRFSPHQSSLSGTCSGSQQKPWKCRIKGEFQALPWNLFYNFFHGLTKSWPAIDGLRILTAGLVSHLAHIHLHLRPSLSWPANLSELLLSDVFYFLFCCCTEFNF